MGFDKEWRDLNDMIASVDNSIPFLQLLGRVRILGHIFVSLRKVMPKPTENSGLGYMFRVRLKLAGLVVF